MHTANSTTGAAKETYDASVKHKKARFDIAYQTPSPRIAGYQAEQMRQARFVSFRTAPS